MVLSPCAAAAAAAAAVAAVMVGPLGVVASSCVDRLFAGGRGLCGLCWLMDRRRSSCGVTVGFWLWLLVIGFARRRGIVDRPAGGCKLWLFASRGVEASILYLFVSCLV